MGFNIMDLMNGATRAAVEGVDNYEAITLNLDEIKVTKHNRYSMDDLEELATSILMDGLQEPLIIGRVNGEYLLSGGHRRREALADLKRIGVHSSYLDEADIKDPLIIEAVLLYCHANFGSPDNQTQLLASYNAMCTKIKGGGYHREANKTID